jgi:DNA transposition AAA+ family ATPase
MMAKSTRNINLSMQQMQAGLAVYRQDGRAGDREVELIEWLWRYAQQDLDGDPDRVAERLGTDWTTIYKVWKGTYEAKLTNFCAKVESLRRRVVEGHVSRFVDTPITRNIWAGLDYARDMATGVLISGPTGSSKTETAKEWARQNNHGKTTYVRVPSRCTRAKLVFAIARAMGDKSRKKDTNAVERMIAKGMGPQKILILDEAGHIIPTSRRSGETPLEYVRDLQDETGCAVAVIVTDCYWQAMLNGPQADILEQFVGRMSYRVVVPEETVYREEVIKMVRLYGGVEPTRKIYELAVRITKASEGRLRTLCEDLRKAALSAKGMGMEMGFLHLDKAREFREAGGSWGEEEVA